jgi:ParB/RepB/Spo0J family partition protein
MVVEAAVQQLDPTRLRPNPENPRLIFRRDDLRVLEESIAHQGILVPLSVYRDGSAYVLLDGERRWRCARKLNLPRVPVIIQPKPDRMTNLMMMFAIHNQRRDWDPLPTALKLSELEREFAAREGRAPREAELAEIASITRGEVRRLKKLLDLPEDYRSELLDELEKPRSEQRLTVDHVLEATNGAAALRKRHVIDETEEEALRRSIVEKFKQGTIANTVEPRQLARIARAVERDEVPRNAARRVVERLITDPNYTIENAFKASVEQADFEHSTEQLARRLEARLNEHRGRTYSAGDALAVALADLRRAIDEILAK